MIDRINDAIIVRGAGTLPWDSTESIYTTAKCTPVNPSVPLNSGQKDYNVV